MPGSAGRACLFLALLGCQATPSPRPPRAAPELRVSPALAARLATVGPAERSVGVVRVAAGEAVYATRSPDGERAFGPRTRFELGSVSKVFAGLLLAEAGRRGEVALADPAEKHLPPGWRLPEHAAGPIRVVHLATHTSGLPPFPSNWTDVDVARGRTTFTEAAFREGLPHETLPFPPGSEMLYGNTGIAVLATLLAEQAGLRYGALLEARIFGPLGMKDSLYRSARLGTRDRLDGHRGAEVVPPREDVSPLGPCCAIATSLRDMAVFLRAAIAETGPLAESFALAGQPHAQVGFYGAVGLGWDVDDERGLLRRNGVVAGYRTTLFVSPRARRGVFVVADEENIDTDIIAETFW
ncbi:MAG: serine hydrolase domain-containing protein [Myxococcota bacterium]